MTQIRVLDSYSEDRWLKGARARDLVSAIDGSPVATMPEAADAAAMLDHARLVGGPALRAMTFQARGRMLRALADKLTEHKEALYELSAHTGATRSDSAFDIEGGIGTFFAYSSLAKKLPDAHFLPEGERLAISKGDFLGQHLLAPLHGVAVHINAYNFPVWGMLEKLAPTLLAGMPAVIKPATVGAYLAEAAFRIIIESGILPPGSVQLLLGEPGDLFDHLGGQDSVAFTGSAATASRLKVHPVLVANTVRFAAEQDSLNAAILGPDVTADAPEFDLFVREVVREMTQKAGQKCTAIRRILVPRAQADAVGDAIVARLNAMTSGDPRAEKTRLGALAGIAQRDDVIANLAALRAEAEILCGGTVPDLGAALAGGAFFDATLLRCANPSSATAVHSVEAFGPVSTLMPYDDVDEATAIANAGAGSLALSIFSHDRAAAARLVAGVSTFHGRILIIDRENAALSSGHGAALPQLQHGGPGRAGGGAELGGAIGMQPYLQRTAIQASAEMLAELETY
ncbi:phenylacetic acid degradation bifunctional protein PaaZ [Sphingopyxis granuli]|uniref:phenylacetic acid degradation bifunctional protein PaaZ n=1 Tax=Sphingopyxis granuli TaxID=267128 RepID=UPI00301CBE07